MEKSRNVNLGSVRYRFFGSYSHDVDVFRSPSLIEPYLIETHTCPDDGLPYSRRVCDVSFLLSYEKKKKFSPEMVNSLVDSLRATSPSSFDSLKSKLSDDQLMALVKSRHIQSPCEIIAWSSYLDSLADDLLKSFASELDSLIPKKTEPEKVQKVEVVNPPKSE